MKAPQTFKTMLKTLKIIKHETAVFILRMQTKPVITPTNWKRSKRFKVCFDSPKTPYVAPCSRCLWSPSEYAGFKSWSPELAYYYEQKRKLN